MVDTARLIEIGIYCLAFVGACYAWRRKTDDKNTPPFHYG